VKEPRHDKYELLSINGVWITVLALVLMVVYGEGTYDEWDLLVSLVVVYFAASYLFQFPFYSYFNAFLVSYLICLGIMISAVSADVVFFDNYVGLKAYVSEVCCGKVNKAYVYPLVGGVVLTVIKRLCSDGN
jgi:hypothetical protein